MSAKITLGTTVSQLFLTMSTFAQTPLAYTLSPWFENKKAAVSITFDDNCDGQFTSALPEMNKRNIRGTFYVNTGQGSCSNPTRWDLIKTAAVANHEIGAHTINHLDLNTVSESEITHQVKDCRDTINARLGNQKCLTIAYPFGSGGTIAESEKVRNIVKQYFISGRGAGINYEVGYIPYNTYKNTNFTNWDYQVESYAVEAKTTKSEYDIVLDRTIQNGGWFIPQYHGIDRGNEFGIIPSSLFIEHVTSIAQRANSIWAAPYVEAFMYHKEKRNATLVAASEDNNGWVLELKDFLPNNIYNHPLTVRLKRPSWMVYAITQNNQQLSYTTDGDTLQFNAVPDNGSIIVNKTALAVFEKVKEEVEVSAFPNPLSSNCYISYTLKSSCNIKVDLFNAQGTLLSTLVHEKQSAGAHKVEVNAGNFSSGMYFFRLSGDVISTINPLIVNQN
ncbi:MAG TPA: polysaccharide deacetylase family protein [Cytophagaceae bacterium]|jgi:peptidoglycan/xylan/chitin deacetylase (PgdA/CDA1 family)